MSEHGKALDLLKQLENTTANFSKEASLTHKRGRQGEGGGRPQKPLEEKKQRVTLTLPPEQIEYLKSTGNASETVRNLIAQAMKKPPAQK